MNSLHEDKRTRYASVVFLLGLAITAFISYISYRVEQENARQYLIHAGTELATQLTQTLSTLPGLLEFARELNNDQLVSLKKLHPELVGYGQWQPPATKQPERLTWLLPPPDALAMLPEIPPPSFAGESRPVYLSRVAENLDADGRQRDYLYAFDYGNPSVIQVALLEISGLLNEALKAKHSQESELELFDLKRYSHDPFFQISLSNQSLSPERAKSGWITELGYQTSLNVLGNDWLLRLHPLESFRERINLRYTLTLFVCGTLISLILALALLAGRHHEEPFNPGSKIPDVTS